MKNTLSSKTIFRIVGIIAIIAIIGFTMTACPPDGLPEPETVEYKGTANGKTYTLKIIENTGRAAYTPKAGDSYELTIDNKKSTGKVESYSNSSTFTLKPSNAGAETFNVTVSPSGITSISGTITFDDKSIDDSAKNAPLTVQPNNGSGGNTNNTTDDDITEVAKDAPVTIGSIDTSTALMFEYIYRYYDDYYYNYHTRTFEPISNYVPSTSITVKDGKLNMKLGTPKNEVLEDWNVQETVISPAGECKSFDFNSNGFYTSDGKYRLYLKGADTKDAGLTYWERDVTITGGSFNYSFKKGWNYFIIEYNWDPFYFNGTSSQTLPSGFTWVIEEIEEIEQ